MNSLTSPSPNSWMISWETSTECFSKMGLVSSAATSSFDVTMSGSTRLKVNDIVISGYDWNFPSCKRTVEENIISKILRLALCEKTTLKVEHPVIPVPNYSIDYASKATWHQG